MIELFLVTIQLIRLNLLIEGCSKRDCQDQESNHPCKHIFNVCTPIQEKLCEKEKQITINKKPRTAKKEFNVRRKFKSGYIVFQALKDDAIVCLLRRIS